MTLPGYREEELVTNRASLLLFNGTEEERRTWAQEAAWHFEAEGPLVEVRQLAELPAALARRNGVVFIPDVARLGREAQLRMVTCLRLQEERPKLVVGLSGSDAQALSRGTLRDDLHYRLHRALVDLADEALREVLRQRWALLTQRLEARAAAEREAAERERQAASARLPGSVTRLLPQAKALPRKVAAKARKQS